MSSFHSGLWLAPLQLPPTALLTFDLLSSVVIPFRKSTSQPLAILMLHETHKIVLGFLVCLKEIQGTWDWVGRVGGSLSKSTLCLALSRKHFHFFLADSYLISETLGKSISFQSLKEELRAPCFSVPKAIWVSLSLTQILTLRDELTLVSKLPCSSSLVHSRPPLSLSQKGFLLLFR